MEIIGYFIWKRCKILRGSMEMYVPGHIIDVWVLFNDLKLASAVTFTVLKFQL